MAKLYLTVIETRSYERGLIIEMPNAVSIGSIEQRLEDAQRYSYTTQNIVDRLSDLGCKIIEKIDIDDYDSPEETNASIQHFEYWYKEEES